MGSAFISVVTDSVFVSVLVAGVTAVTAAEVRLLVESVFLGLCPVAGSAFLSEAGGTVTSVFCSHAPKSAALARMQINFFILWVGFLYWGKA